MKYAKANKTLIIETFAPTFCFAADEYVFPISAETYSADVLQAKMRHYESMLAKNSVFNKDQTEEYNLMKENFFGSGDSRSKFNIKGFET